MKLSEVIARLSSICESEGDIELVIGSSYSCHQVVSIGIEYSDGWQEGIPFQFFAVIRNQTQATDTGIDWEMDEQA